MRGFQLFDWKRIRLLSAVNLLRGSAAKWRFSSQREPKRFPKGVDVGTHVELRMLKLFWAGECRCTDKAVSGQGHRIGLSVKRLRQTEVDYFYARDGPLSRPLSACP